MKTKHQILKHAIVLGATGGIGSEVVPLLLADGWTLGIAGRSEEKLRKLQQLAPNRIYIQTIDITSADAPQHMNDLIARTGGMQLYVALAGVGHQNPTLDTDLEVSMLNTNILGYVRMMDTAFAYFKANGGGHIAAVTSVAGTKGLGMGAAYSAAKRFQVTYLDSLVQLSYMQHLHIKFTDIRPGFVRTPLLSDGFAYPMEMKPQKVAKHIVRAIRHKRRMVIIDWRYFIMVMIWRVVPQYLWERISVAAKKS
jgi:short-subunit dehydrogenase